MDLILWRHAEAEEAAPGGSDAERERDADPHAMNDGN